MPLMIPADLPAIDVLSKEKTFFPSMVDDKTIVKRPMRIAVLNLMPLKIQAETDLIRIFASCPFLVDLNFVSLDTHKPKNTSEEHMNKFYTSFKTFKHCMYDGFIVTGAPVEHLKFEEVSYWNEMQQILDWAKQKSIPSLYICWAAQAALYHYYHIDKYPLEKKMFGIFEHSFRLPANPLFSGFDNKFYAPHSRYTEIRFDDVEKHAELLLTSFSDEAGVYIVQARNGKETYITGHPEYAPETLHEEYLRDKAKNLPIEPPSNYYIDNKPENEPLVRWRAHANQLFLNWLHWFVYPTFSCNS